MVPEVLKQYNLKLSIIFIDLKRVASEKLREIGKLDFAFISRKENRSKLLWETIMIWGKLRTNDFNHLEALK